MSTLKKAAAILGLAAALFTSCPAHAANVTLPNTASSTTMTATVTEQATITVPANITWTVNDVTSATSQTTPTAALTVVDVSNIAVDNGKGVRVLIAASSANFTAPGGAGTTWAAGDVTWSAPTITAGGGGSASTSAGTLSTTYQTVAQSNQSNPNQFTFNNFTFTLGAKPTVNKAGAHTLTCTWRVESY